MTKSRTPTWVGVILAPIGLLLVAMLYMSTIGARLHPNPQDVPSVMDSAPLPKWAAAVEQARQIVRVRLSEENLPGVSVAVGIGGDIVWAEGFGFADLRTSSPVTPSHRFRIGTASTALAAAAAGMLLEDGRLKLDDEIQQYLRAFPKKQWPVTLRALMGHTAGIIPDGDGGRPLFTEHCKQTVEALPYFAENPLLFEPGTQYRYSDNGWILVSAAVEAAANQPFLAFMRERVFDPLGMRNTVPDSAPEADDDFPLANLIREKIFDPRTARKNVPDSAKRPMQDPVTSYFPRWSSNPKYGLHLMRPVDFSCYAGSGVFLSTPSDLVRFGMAIHSGKLLQPATVELLQTPQRLASGRNTDHGLGWDIGTVTLAGKSTRIAGRHGELLGGMAASLMTLPEYGMVVSVTSNISHADTFSFGVKIADVFAEQGASRR